MRKPWSITGPGSKSVTKTGATKIFSKMPASSMLALFVRTNCVSWRKQTWIVRLLCLSRSRNGLSLGSDRINYHRQSRWYEEGPLKGPLLEVTSSGPTPMEITLLIEVPTDLMVSQPGCAHEVSSNRAASAGCFRVQQPSGNRIHAGNGRAFRSLTARGGGFVLDLEFSPLRPRASSSGSLWGQTEFCSP